MTQNFGVRRLSAMALILPLAALVIWAADWPTQGGNPQREGWARAEKAFTRENAGNIELLYKYKADNQARGENALTSPLVNGMLITYRGFKEMLVFGGSSDNVYSVDADLNRIIWKRHFEYLADKPAPAPTAACPGGLTASVAMPGSSTATGRGGGGGRGLFATGFGRSGVFLALSSDGYLHALNTSTGADKVPPVRFVPAGSNVAALNVNDSVIYAATQDDCGGSPPALYALDMSGDQPKLKSVALPGATKGNAGGTAISSNGFVFSNAGQLTYWTKDLELKGQLPETKVANVAPFIFQWQGKDVTAIGTADGRLSLLSSVGDTPGLLTQSEPVAGHFEGSFSSWEDTDAKSRWIYAPVRNASGESIAAFRLQDRDGKPVLTTAWTSDTFPATATTATANGLLFVVSSGELKGRATLFVLDGGTGRQLYSSGNLIGTFARNGGLAVANRRIYLTAHDNTVYCFGFMNEQPQLTGK